VTKSYRLIALSVLCVVMSPVSLYAVGGGSSQDTPKEARPPTEYKRVPWDFLEGGVKPYPRWIQVPGMGQMYVPAKSPPPFPRCTESTPPGGHCYNEIEGQ